MIIPDFRILKDYEIIVCDAYIYPHIFSVFNANFTVLMYEGFWGKCVKNSI